MTTVDRDAEHDVLSAVAAAREQLRLQEALLQGQSKPPTAPDNEGAAPDASQPTGLTVRRSRLRRFGTWLNRSRRVLLTLGAVWVVAVFDLGFTIAQWGNTSFVELNPIAAALLNGPVSTIAFFKFGFLGVGTLILLGLRRYFIAELACWFLLATKIYLAIRWYVYFDCVLRDHVNPLITAAS